MSQQESKPIPGANPAAPATEMSSSAASDRKIHQAQREREKMAARRERRATYDLPTGLRNGIQALSAELRIPASQLAALAIARFLTDYQNSEIDLGIYKTPSRSPRYDWNLEIPETNAKSKKKINLLKSLK